MHRPFPVVAALVLVLLFGACGDDSDANAPTTTPPATTTSPTTTPPTTTPPSTTAGPSCSAAGMSPSTSPQAGLPSVVATMRADLARATASCDWTALAALVDRNGPGVRFSFGAPGNAIEYWQRHDADDTAPRPLRALRTLLDLPYATQPLTGDAVQYVWPAAHVSVPPTPAQLHQIADTGLYPRSMLDEWVRVGANYLGYRLAITATGDWSFFVAGD